MSDKMYPKQYNTLKTLHNSENRLKTLLIYDDSDHE